MAAGRAPTAGRALARPIACDAAAAPCAWPSRATRAAAAPPARIESSIARRRRSAMRFGSRVRSRRAGAAARVRAAARGGSEPRGARRGHQPARGRRRPRRSPLRARQTGCTCAWQCSRAPAPPKMMAQPSF
eukprot:6401054-Prymnesium_polylepis.1